MGRADSSSSFLRSSLSCCITSGQAWFLFLCTSAVSGSAITTSYVSADAATSYAVTILFALQFLFFLPTTIKSFKSLGKTELPQQGPFVKRLATASGDAGTPKHAANL